MSQLGEALGQIAAAAFSAAPRTAWRFVPVDDEGVMSAGWPAEDMASALAEARKRVAELARFGPDRDVLMSAVAFEAPPLTGLITPEDVASLVPGHLALAHADRDAGGRWRAVLASVGVSQEVTPADVLVALDSPAFASRPPEWWVEAAARLTACCESTAIMREQHDLSPRRLAADTAYGSAEMLDWLVNEQGVEPHIPVIDKSNREDGTFSRSDFAYDQVDDLYLCPGGKELKRYRRAFSEPRTNPPPDDTHRYRATKADCNACTLKSRCCPNTPARKVTRSIYEAARDFARDIAKTDAYVTSRRERKKVEMLFAHLKRILKLDRLRLRGPCDARDEFHFAATAQNLRKLAKLIPTPAPATA